MIRKTVTYEDFNGEEQTEDVYFHLSKSELIDMEVGKEGGMSAFLADVVKSGDIKKILEVFRDLLSKAYGTRSEDGRRFIKDPKVTADFMESPAFEALFTELITSESAVTQFVLGIIPKDMRGEAERSIEVVRLESQKDESDQPAWIRENREPTSKELREMSHDQLLEVYKRRMTSPPGSQE